MRLLAAVFGLPLILKHGGLERRSAQETPFEVVQESKPACSIVIAENPTPGARLAALELQLHILKLSVAELPIRSEIGWESVHLN